MKIQKLEIKNIRGIPDLEIDLKGKSLVIYGPNGSGKSAVIDALDFLLTGKIARLIGEGTDGVSLKDHGPHIDKVADLSNVEVAAQIQLHGKAEALRICRKMNKPTKLIYDPNYHSALLPIIELLERGQHVFTRRELLKLITAKSSTRATEIQKVLKLVDLEATRKALVAVQNESKREYTTALNALVKCKADIIAITGHKDFNSAEVLKFVNTERAKLSGPIIEDLKSGKIQQGLSSVKSNPLSVNHEELEKHLMNLKQNELHSLTTEAMEADILLRKALTEIRADEQASWNNKRHQFTKDGISLIRKSGECPLCDNGWAEGKLALYLQQRIEAQSERQTQISANRDKLTEKAKAITIRIQQIKEMLNSVSKTAIAKSSKPFQDMMKILSDWSFSLTKLETALKRPLELYTDNSFDKTDVEKLYIPESLGSNLYAFEKEIKTLFPEATPEQTAWDNLTKLVERLKLFEEHEATLAKATLVTNRAKELVEAYISTRDEVLESLYDKIKHRFVGLYREMHGSDEKNFNASFIPQEAALNFEVDFYGRGYHPPHAMHSEGHQDSMGVCLFLALSEHLNTGLIDIIILDDVVMSVDSGHRRSFCNVLVNNFPDRQFIITTHDTTWANQLKSAGLVPGKQMLKFSNWDVETGPDVHYEADMWGRMKSDLDNDDVPAAAAKLRRGMEEFTRYVCHSLKANVPYTIDDAGSLGDFLPAAIGRYTDLLNDAKKAARSWGQAETLAKVEEADLKRIEVVTRTNAEQWSINKSVHYNAWADFHKEDFIPVMDAFKELYEKIFSCPSPNCQAVLNLTFEGGNKTGLRCKCGTVNWNLTKKK